MRTFIHLLTCFLLFQAYSATAQKSPVLYEPGHEASLDVTNTVVLRWKAAEIPDAKEISYKVQIFDIGIGQMVQIKGSPVTFMNTQTPVLEVVQKKGLAVAWTVPEKAVGRKYQWRVITLVNGQPRNFEMEMGNQFYINSLTIKTDEVNKTITAENNNNPPGKPKAPAQQKDTVPAKPQSENTISYTRPVLHFPNQGASIKVTAINTLQFSWYPISPKPKQAITYRWFVFEMKAGRSATDIVQDASPVLKGNVKGVTDVTLNLPANAPGKTYVWTVQAVNDAGVAYGDNNGYADPFVFSVQSAGKVTGPTDPGPGVMRANCFFVPKIDSIWCTGSCKNGKSFTVRIKLDNTNISSSQMSFDELQNYQAQQGINAYQPYVTTWSTLIQPWLNGPGSYGSPNSSISITPLTSSYPAKINVGEAPLVEVSICVPDGTTLPIRLRVFTSMLSSEAVTGNCSEDVVINALPICPCNYCDDKSITIIEQQDRFSESNNVLNYSAAISIPRIKIKQLKAELIGFSYEPENKNEQCLICNKDDRSFGNITGGSFSLWPAMTIGALGFDGSGGNTRHTIGWWGGNALNVNNTSLNLSISLPTATTLSCCNMNVTLCIRITFMDDQCRSCSIVKCVPWVRKPSYENVNGGKINN